MNPNTKKIKLYVFLMLLFSLAAVSLRTVACIRDLGYIYGYFEDRFLINLSGYFVAGGVAILITYSIFAEKMNTEPSFSTPATYVPTGIVSVGIPYLAITIMRSLDKNATALTRNLAIILVFLATLSVIHFFLTAFNTESDAEVRGYFSLATVLFLAFYAAYLYFDTSLPINSTNKIIDQIAFLLSSLFFLYEARLSLVREKWTGYVTFGLVSALLCAYSSIPSVIVYITKGAIISNSIEESVFTLTLFLFITSRLILASMTKERKKNKIIEAMSEFAESRSAMIHESMKVHKEAFAVQMTIDDLIGTEAELIYTKTSEDENEVEQTEEFEATEDEEQMNFFCEGGLEISESDVMALKAEEDRITDLNNEDTEDDYEEDTCN